jgi:1A family penicillin-binding protein
MDPKPPANPQKPAPKRPRKPGQARPKGAKTAQGGKAAAAAPKKHPVPGKRKRARAAVKKPSILKKLIFLSALGMVAVCIATYMFMDNRVTSRLRQLEAGNLPVMYSSTLNVGSLMQRLSGSMDDRRKLLRTALSERRYSEVQGSPSRPGEYAFQSDRLVVYTREFRSASGEVIQPRKASLPLAEAQSASASGTDTAPVILEPQIISFIGAGEVRASKFTPLAELPQVIQNAVIATEDERFFSHAGIDLLGIVRAAVRNIIAGGLVQGGSTITQQLAKNLFLSPKKTFTRKFLEIPTALSLERHLTKPQLLELYLNEVYLGQEGAVAIHGMPQAAGAFFGKQIGDISIDEAAILAGMIKAPSYFNPKKHADRAKERRNIVLGKMRELGMISDSDYQAAVRRPLKVSSQQEHRRVAPYFTSALELELSEPLDLDNAQGSGLTIHTGLDLSLQRCAETAVATGIAALEKRNPKLSSKERPIEAALVSLDPQSGLVRSWVGGRDFSMSQFNRVNQATRQIGSTIKPFLYLTALDGSLNSYKVASPSSILEDKPIEISIKHQGVWSPENYDHDYRGDVTLRYALENSLNMPALYIAERVGLPALRRTTSAFRLADKVSEVPSLALGALDSTLLRLTAAYGALANSGVLIAPRLYVSALGDQGERLALSEIKEARVADEAATYVLTSLLGGVVENGTAKNVRTAGYQGPAAGKTGTSDNGRDAWFIGYSPNLVTGVWVGFDDNTPTGLTGGSAAAPIWGEFMRCATPFITPEEHSPPPGVVFVDIDRNSGARFTEACPESARLREVFVKGTEPVRLCPTHGDSTSEYAPSSADSGTSGVRRGSPPARERSFWGTLFGN